MGWCAAPFCNNSAKKGYIMKVFPRDPERRALWQRNVPRENWTATNNSYLCEVYFSPEMWEQIRDKKRKLKPGAVPTIFGFFVKKKNIDISRNEQVSKEHAKEEQVSIDRYIIIVKRSKNICTLTRILSTSYRKVSMIYCS
ncbi:THAP domain-containing protein 2 [Temnothorax longispinosus]|uniref:THAP domain-containing protein 2 n=1 Tax=Temnothorax longispinosus TaxID=300112 RepID=A0A4S2KTB7_9HYME|nr:THAP domain-containing protein 2 [Temnothorax longispinosus]